MPQPSPRLKRLQLVLHGVAIVLILRVLVSILANYPDYFPPRFDSLFLQGREQTFHGLYVWAFYFHIFSAPVVLVNGLILLIDRLRLRYARLHRYLGYLKIEVLLGLMLPSSLWMSRFAFGGWPAGVSFLLLTLSTAACAIIGLNAAIHRRYASHRRWMLRSYVLICSAVVLRLISGAATLLELENAERAYAIAAWCSWLIPLSITMAVDTGRWNFGEHSRPVR